MSESTTEQSSREQELPLVQSTAPDHIWLDLGEDFGPAMSASINFRDLEEVTWSEDNATGNGIKYVRADLSGSAESGEAVAAFDAAVAEEIQRVSHVEYDSHEICKHFAGKVRERLLLSTPSALSAQAVGEIVRWEWRHFDTANEPHTWSAWQVVEPRNPYTDTMADRVREYQGYIDAGYKYELRGLCVATPMPQPEGDPSKLRELLQWVMAIRGFNSAHRPATTAMLEDLDSIIAKIEAIIAAQPQPDTAKLIQRIGGMADWLSANFRKSEAHDLWTAIRLLTQPQPEPTSKGEKLALMPYEPTEAMRWAAKNLDPVLTHDNIRALWSAMWVAAYRSQQREPQEAAEQHREERLELAKAMLKRCGHAARNIGFDAASRKEHEDAAEDIVRAIVDGIDLGGKQ